MGNRPSTTVCQRRRPPSRDGGTRTRALVLPRHAGCRCPTSRHLVRTGGFEPPISWSPTRRDNQASLRSVSSSCGSRTRLCALKGRNPVPIDERAISARTVHAVDTSRQRAPFTQWVGRCSNPRPLVFSQVLHHLSYRPNEKSLMSLGHQAFGILRERYGLMSQAQWIGRGIRRMIGECTRPSSRFVTQA